MKSEVISNIVAAAIVGAIGLVLYVWEKWSGMNLPEPLRAAAIALLLLVLLCILFRHRIRDAVLDRLVKVWARRAGGTFGLVRFYPNFRAAEGEIRERFKAAKAVRIFIQLGRNILGGDDKSLLFDAARGKRSSDEAIRVLCAGEASDQLTPGRARDLASSHTSWMAAVRYTLTNIDALEKEGVAIEARCHREPYLWRLFFLDDVLFLVPYVSRKQNDLHAPVLEIHQVPEGQPSIYALFERYFEDIWSRCAPLATPSQPGRVVPP